MVISVNASVLITKYLPQRLGEQTSMMGEAGYFFTLFYSALSFIEGGGLSQHDDLAEDYRRAEQRQLERQRQQQRQQ
eukprot:COSAG01_NODE_4892_length_4648_cov_3.866344_5_plen_77_part_00